MATPSSSRQTSSVRTLWSRRDFRLLLIGQGVSGLGDWMATVGLMALVLELTSSSTAVGGVLVLRLAPTAIAGPLAGRLSQRLHRKSTMLAMDAVRIGIVLLLPLLHALWWVYLWAFLLEVAGIIFLPARDASIPDLAGDDDLPLANGLVLGSSYGTIPLGAGLFAAVLALTGSTVVAFWADAATFAVSFACISRLQIDDSQWGDEDEHADAGFRASLRLPLVRVIAPIAFVVAMGLGSLFSLGIVFVRDVLGASDVEFAVLVALFGVGAGVGLAALHLLGIDASLPVLRRLVLGQGVVVAGMSLSPTIGLAFLGAVLFGAATAGALATAMSFLQERLNERDRTLAFTAFHVVIRIGIGIAAIASGTAADIFDHINVPWVGAMASSRVVLVLSGLIVVASVLVSAAFDGHAETEATRGVGRGAAAAESA